jgi:EAL domain-containing protein (putative c-di-GMP-specific phosphodiesterase class I)
VEALARWRHPERGPIPPAHFIALAEQADLIVPLGQWVLRKACEDAAFWRRSGHPDLRVAVNLSARQLAYPRLLEIVTETLDEYGIDGSALALELTETALCANGEATPQTLQALRGMGVSLFVDDFGTGYSSLAYLRRFPVDALKIDRAFIAGLGTKSPDGILVSALIEMAHALELQVVAEGVETPQQWEWLQSAGCDLVQGYLYGRPVTRDALLTTLAASEGLLKLQAVVGDEVPKDAERGRSRRPILSTTT